MDLKLRAILSGLSTYLPGYNRKGFTGGTDSARYCYSAWLRHRVLGAQYTKLASVPRVVAELGPGDSIGIGLAALLSGAQKYIALDLVHYSNLSKNLQIFDELVSLFAKQESIPDESEFPFLYPKLDSYVFPRQLVEASGSPKSLSVDRVSAIRASISRCETEGSMISYKAPWSAPQVIDDGSVDLVFSQAVLEHIDDLEGAYAAMRTWLKPDGIMTHQIDFKCHGKANFWNGHWTYGDFLWKVMVGRRAYLLNRQPHSVHLDLMRRTGFQILQDRIVSSVSEIRRGQLASRFRDLSDDDLSTSGAFIVAAAGRGM